MPKGSPELTRARKDEIVEACKELYAQKSFKEISLQDIADSTSFTRTSIYNYFQTKEEILMEVLRREYLLWAHELDAIAEEHESLTADSFAYLIAKSIERRPLMIKILSMNHYEMEANSRLSELTRFKGAFGVAKRAMVRLLEKYFIIMTSEDRQHFMYIFFPFMFGIYAYTDVTEKQVEAMSEAGCEYTEYSAYQLTYDCVFQLLKAYE